MKKDSEDIFDKATRMAGAYRAGSKPDDKPDDNPDVELDAHVAKLCAPDPIEQPASTERKTYPMYSGLLKYFPDALMEISRVSYVGNEQHNPGEPLHWDREKSMDQEDCIVRHLKDRIKNKFDTDGERHMAKAAWRSLAALQLEIEKDRG
jgi:hypothetical protein